MGKDIVRLPSAGKHEVKVPTNALKTNIDLGSKDFPQQVDQAVYKDEINDLIQPTMMVGLGSISLGIMAPMFANQVAYLDVHFKHLANTGWVAWAASSWVWVELPALSLAVGIGSILPYIRHRLKKARALDRFTATNLANWLAEVKGIRVDAGTLNRLAKNLNGNRVQRRADLTFMDDRGQAYTLLRGVDFDGFVLHETTKLTGKTDDEIRELIVQDYMVGNARTVSLGTLSGEAKRLGEQINTLLNCFDGWQLSVEGQYLLERAQRDLREIVGLHEKLRTLQAHDETDTSRITDMLTRIHEEVHQLTRQEANAVKDRLVTHQIYVNDRTGVTA